MKAFNNHFSGIWSVRQGLVVVVLLLLASFTFAQNQQCPSNINFSSGDMRFWSARTGLLNGGFQLYPPPNNGLRIIPEYTMSSTGVEVISTQGSDLYGSFPLIPTINGYSYGYSVKLGSSATSFDLRAANGGTTSNPGGFVRALSYTIDVPAGSPAVPFTMTYAYAMVLENGTHNSNQQPLFKAILSTEDSTVTCASPQYYLPTFNDAGSGGTGSGSTGATLDTAAALANGFSLSPVPFLSHTGNNNVSGTLLYDVWTKAWTEVTFDLSAYRGRQVTLTFETDNCAPGGHFAYAYVAVRNTCAGLEISGSPVACANTNMTYSIPALAGAVYNWTVPAGWTIVSGANSNILNVIAGTNGGQIIAHEINGCADLRDTLNVTTTLATIPGQVNSNNTVCSGTNNTLLSLAGERGTVINWISSTDGLSWNIIGNQTTSYTAQNLTSTTQYRALVQNGAACRIDTSAAAIITVDPRTVAGTISPASTTICLGQNADNLLTLSGHTGAVENWQRSFDNNSWAGVIPVNNAAVHPVLGVNTTQYYRAVVKSGVCPADTSSIATINFANVPYPAAVITPDFSTICFGTTANLNATITTGTSYTWSNTSTLTSQGSGNVTTIPQVINAIASPRSSTSYVFSLTNAGCPNIYRDTFVVQVRPRIVVFAGNDTSIVANQPLQLEATVNDPTATNFNWSPGTGLSFTNIYNPVATLGPEYGDYITYIVRATNPDGCYGEDDIRITVFKTGPDIFVPTGFTPNNDGINDKVFPICVGISRLEYFRVFNRWGQLVFQTNRIGDGWDGRIKGQLQDTNNFVFMVQGTDYTGRVIFKKGSIMLIR